MGSGMCCVSGEDKTETETPTHIPVTIPPQPPSFTPGKLHEMILETLVVIRFREANDNERFNHFRTLQKYAEVEQNWLTLMVEMVKVLAIEDPLAHLVIWVLVDECSVPSNELTGELCALLGVTKDKEGGGEGEREVGESGDGEMSDGRKKKINGGKKEGLSDGRKRGMSEVDEYKRKLVRRNTCIVLACLAEKMAGPKSVSLLTDVVLEYLLDNIRHHSRHSIALFSIIALEKFALTSENKSRIMTSLRLDNVLSRLECHHDNQEDMTLRQIAFCCQWSLDNIFVLEDRVLTYTTLYDYGANNSNNNNDNNNNNSHQIHNNRNNNINNNKEINTNTNNHKKINNNNNNDNDNNQNTNNKNNNNDVTNITSVVNVILNQKDASEYLKLSADGLEARCDAMSFESVRGTHGMKEGRWYYEVLVVTPGVMQVGWASKQSKFLCEDGCGIGDDKHSIAYDGCRQAIWHDAKNSRSHHRCWKPGDVLGLLLDIEKQEVSFCLDGSHPTTVPFKICDDNYFAAASFMTFQQCLFNFGASPFRHPPSCPFLTPNHHAHLTNEERRIIPRLLKLSLLKSMSISEDSCVLCADHKASVALLPCLHRGFCEACCRQLNTCPICRTNILSLLVSPSSL